MSRRLVPCPEVFAAARFQVASPDELQSRLRSEQVVALDPDERADVEHHRPDTVGEVLSNRFD
jgi:hypothetical protein